MGYPLGVHRGTFKNSVTKTVTLILSNRDEQRLIKVIEKPLTTSYYLILITGD